MKSKTVVLAATAALSLGASSAAPGATPSAVGHCRVGEQVVFSCKVKNGNTVSLCATGTLTAAGASIVKMQYRFGPMRSPELLFPAQPAHPRSVFLFSATGYAGGGEERIRFSSGGYDYVLFKSSIAGSWLPGGYREHFEDDGVIVLKARKLIGVQMCRDLDESASFSAVSDVLEHEQFDHDIDTPCCGEKPASR